MLSLAILRTAHTYMCGTMRSVVMASGRQQNTRRDNPSFITSRLLRATMLAAGPGNYTAHSNAHNNTLILCIMSIDVCTCTSTVSVCLKRLLLRRTFPRTFAWLMSWPPTRWLRGWEWMAIWIACWAIVTVDQMESSFLGLVGWCDGMADG